MPALSRYLMRAAFFNLWAGFGLAAFLMAWKGRPELVPSAAGAWILAHVDLLLVGWMVQLAMGTAYWILPRLRGQPTERGRFGLAVGAGLLLNGGVWAYTLGLMGGWGAVQVAGLAAQLLAVGAYILHALPRIRSAGR